MLPVKLYLHLSQMLLAHGWKRCQSEARYLKSKKIWQHLTPRSRRLTISSPAKEQSARTNGCKLLIIPRIRSERTACEGKRTNKRSSWLGKVKCVWCCGALGRLIDKPPWTFSSPLSECSLPQRTAKTEPLYGRNIKRCCLRGWFIPYLSIGCKQKVKVNY